MKSTTHHALAWRSVWKDPKGFLILTKFRGASSHFRFDLFYIVDFHSALIWPGWEWAEWKHMIYTWYTHDMHMIYTRFIWYTHDMRMVAVMMEKIWTILFKQALSSQTKHRKSNWDWEEFRRSQQVCMGKLVSFSVPNFQTEFPSNFWGHQAKKNLTSFKIFLDFSLKIIRFF